MVKNPSFYSVIIGTEILNGRRKDKHFDFLNKELLKRGWEQKANFVIKDDPSFMEDVFNLVKKDPNSVMFSFGGIGATPDDYTREVAAKVFSNGIIEQNQDALKLIKEQFGKEAYPHRVNMANLPRNAILLKNVVNNVPGFGVDERFFFVPGFPEMAWHMVKEALDRFYPKNRTKHSCNFIVHSSENDILDIMKSLPLDLEFSSLPKFIGDKRIVEIYIADFDENRVKKWCEFFKGEVKKKDLRLEDL
ncbi:MAG: competence/damage-inducible protein A [Epsilonproteobacteria bacterium]|nr:competence/damage-inducible protein A [Campylobacterota bacterium]